MLSNINDNPNFAENVGVESLKLTGTPQSLTPPDQATKALIQIVSKDGSLGNSPSVAVAMLSESENGNFDADIEINNALYLFDFSFYEVRSVKNLYHLKLKNIYTSDVFAKIQYFK